jgi:hypothetical protein
LIGRFFTQQDATAPANVAQLSFTWASWDGTLHTSTVVSDPVLPKSPKAVAPAPAQELILAAFQEEGWPPAIDDPLPSQFNQDPKRRLHYTVRNLNRGQKPIRIRFFINGNGETIRWKLVAPQRAKSARRARKRR